MATEETEENPENPPEGVAQTLEPTPYETVRESLKRFNEETERVNAIINEILTRQRTYKDEEDDSIHPSFTNFKVPYHMTCRLRYSKKKEEYERQFQHELHEMLNHQPSAYDAARFNRHLCVTTLWPPLHNRKEIEYFHNYFFRMSHEQKKRLEFIMNTNIN